MKAGVRDDGRGAATWASAAAVATSLLVAGLAACAHAGASAGSKGLEFRVAVGPELVLDQNRQLWVTLSLVNTGTRTAYVSPVIGQLCPSLEIRAHRLGAEREGLLYSCVRMWLAFDLGSLFPLEPGRRLELEMPFHWADTIEDAGAYDLWAELDCTGMDKVVPQAFAGKLRSNVAHFVVTRRPRGTEP
jgi:hypothetical protein